MGDISVRTVLQHILLSLSLRLTRIVTEKVFIHRFTGVSVLFHEAKLEQHMLHFKL